MCRPSLQKRALKYQQPISFCSSAQSSSFLLHPSHFGRVIISAAPSILPFHPQNTWAQTMLVNCLWGDYITSDPSSCPAVLQPNREGFIDTSKMPPMFTRSCLQLLLEAHFEFFFFFCLPFSGKTAATMAVWSVNWQFKHPALCWMSLIPGSFGADWPITARWQKQQRPLNSWLGEVQGTGN